jgi:phosphoribosylformylglycinamidine synthase
MQDMGAAGITCSTAEMSAKGEHGMNIHLDKVPTRQKNMKGWEMLLSESQERMLIVVQKGREKEVLDVFDKWDLHCVQIGEVTKEPILRFYMNGALEAEVPAESLVLGGGAPQYHRAYVEPKYFEKIKAFDIQNIPDITNAQKVAEKISQLPNIASKRWVYTQYDSMVGTANASTNAPSDAAIVVVKGTRKALAVTTDCNSRYVYADPHTGGQIAVAEAARNIVCSGGEPVAITNCLNFGNPYDPEVYYQFVHAVQGMGEACRKFNTPVTGGNVSFYNQSPDGPVYPTPTIGMLGVLDSMEQRMTLGFKQAGDVIYLVGRSYNDINSSEYLHKLIGVEHSPAPHFSMEEEYRLQQAITKLISAKLISSAHDVSEGGLFTTLLESAMVQGLGFDVHTNKHFRKDAYLFGESQSRVVVSVRPENQEKFEALLHGLVDASDYSVRYEKIGTVKGDHIVVDGEDWGAVAGWKGKYDTALENHLQ